MQDENQSAEDEIGCIAGDLEKLGFLTESLAKKMSEADDRSCVNPEFIRRSLASVFESQAILSRSFVRALKALRTSGDETPVDDVRPPPRPRQPHLKLVDPES